MINYRDWCVSRPDYRELQLLRKLFPHVPILALSATCPPDVRDDLLSILQMDKPIVNGYGTQPDHMRLALSNIVRQRRHSRGQFSLQRHYIGRICIIQSSQSPPPLQRLSRWWRITYSSITEITRVSFTAWARRYLILPSQGSWSLFHAYILVLGRRDCCKRPLWCK